MFQNKENRIGIFRSLIASTIFLIFLKPILEFLWRGISNISSSTYSSFIDQTYISAALGQRNWIDFIIFSIAILVGAQSITMLTFFLLRKNKLQKLAQEISLEKDEPKKKLLMEKLQNKTNSKLIEGYMKRFNLIGPVSITMTIICAIILIFNAYTDLQLNTSFNQQLNTLSPYITDQEIKQVKSKWSLMKTKIDYKDICNYLDSVAAVNKIILPKRLLN